VYTSDTAKRRFEVLARQVFTRFKALLTEPAALQFAERHDNIEAIYKKLMERRDTADVTAVLKDLHRIVNAAIRTDTPGDDQAAGRTYDLSKINMEKLRDEFAKKVKRKATALKDIRDVVEARLAQMLGKNATRMDYQKRYEDIVADYNNDKNRVTIEETFRRLMELADSLDDEQNRHVREGLSEEELALFDLLKRDGLSRKDRERVKQASRDLLAAIQQRLGQLDRFWEKEQTKSDVEVFILDKVYAAANAAVHRRRQGSGRRPRLPARLAAGVAGRCGTGDMIERVADTASGVGRPSPADVRGEGRGHAKARRHAVMGRQAAVSPRRQAAAAASSNTSTPASGAIDAAGIASPRCQAATASRLPAPSTRYNT